MTTKQIIRSNREKCGIESDKKLMSECGIPYSTYSHERTRDDGSFVLREMREIIKVTNMPYVDILSWVYGRDVSVREIAEQIFGGMIYEKRTEER